MIDPILVIIASLHVEHVILLLLGQIKSMVNIILV